MNLVRVLLVLLSLISGIIYAQNAPVTTLGSVTGTFSSPVVVSVTVTNFDNIGALTLTLDYYYPSVHFVQGLPNAQLPTMEFNESDLGNDYHRIYIAWYGSGLSLSAGTEIINLTFTYMNGESSLNWYDNGGSCEYADGSANVLNDIPSNEYYINGYICGELGEPVVTGPALVCQGQTNVTYSVAPLSNATSYNWYVPPDAILVNGNGTTLITVDYLTTANSGFISVFAANECGNGSSVEFPVTVYPLPIANAGTDTTLGYSTSTQLHATNAGTGVYNYHWSPENLLLDPNIQSPQTIQLTSSVIFHLHVTNSATLCYSDDEMSVNISGGPLSVNPLAFPVSICRGSSAQLYANTGGGSGNYTYSWTSIPPGTPAWNSNQQNPVVSPDSSSYYLLVVNDGFNTISGSTALLVHQLPSANINGGGSVCDNGSLASIFIDLAGTPPWSFIYSNGLTSTPIYNQSTNPYIIETSVPGNYTVISINDNDCAGIPTGYANVEIYPVPPTPVISQTATILVSDALTGNQWYMNGISIPGATGQSYIPFENGQYFVIVTINDCTSDTSNLLDVIIASRGELEMGNIEVYPNPAKDYLVMKTSEIYQEEVEMKLLNTKGVVIKKYIIPNTSLMNRTSINIMNLQAGMYFLTINSGEQIFIKKLVVL